MPFPWETVPPLAIICGATALMGALPHGIQKLFYGKPKAVLQDSWDRQVAKRDERVIQEWQDGQEAKACSIHKALQLLAFPFPPLTLRLACCCRRKLQTFISQNDSPVRVGWVVEHRRNFKHMMSTRWRCMLKSTSEQ